MITWWEGKGPNGEVLHIDEDPYAGTGQLTIDGESVKVDRVDRLRDGGSTILRYGDNTLFIDRKLGRSKHVDYLNDQALERS